MLENTNDYLSILAVFILLGLVIALVIYFINLRVIEKNVKKEVLYYDYDTRNSINKKKNYE